MVKLRVLDLLSEKQLTKYWLYKRMDMTYQNFSKMINNETTSIKYENINKLCILLECMPTDLFEFDNKNNTSE